MNEIKNIHQNKLFELPFTIDVVIKHTNTRGLYNFRGEVIINFEKISSLVLPFQITIYDEVHFNCDSFEKLDYCSTPTEKLWIDCIELLEEKSSYKELIQQKKEELLHE